MKKSVFILLLFGLLCTLVGAQSDSVAIAPYDTAPLNVQKINEDDLQTYRNNPDFDYEVVKTESTWWDDFKIWLSNLFSQLFEWLFGVEKAVGYLVVFFRIVPYILLAILLFVLIKFFLNVNTRALRQAKKNQAIVSLSEEEHIIKNEDIQQLIQQALTDKNYRLAVRYYYLYILQLMSEKEIIAWELQKTNDDYLNEIKKQTLKQLFKTTTRLYDYIWYGGFDINEAKYKRVEVAFLSLRKSLKNG